MDGVVKTAEREAELRRQNEDLCRRLREANSSLQELQQRAAALQYSQESLGTMLLGGQMGMWELNLATDQVIRNASESELLGIPHTEEPVSTKFFIEHIHPDDRPGFEQSLAQLKAQGSDWCREFRFIRPDGEERWLVGAGRMFRDEGGRPSRLIGVNYDVTWRKRAEQTLFETRQRLQAVMKAIPIGISFSDDTTCERITGNPALLTQFEIADGDNVSAASPDPNSGGRRIRYFANGRELTAEDLPLQRAVAENREIAPTELEIVLPNGRRWFAEASGAPIRDENSNVIAGVAATLDITARKLDQEALRASESRFRLLSEVASRLLAADDPETLVQELCAKVMVHLDCQLFVNFLVDKSEGGLRLNARAGLTDEEVERASWLNACQGKCTTVYDTGQSVVVDDVEKMPALNCSLVRSLGIRAYCCHPLVAGTQLIGTLCFGSRNRAAFSAEDTNLIRTVADHIAIAMQRVSAQRALRESKEQAEAAALAKDEFLAVLSHELRTPLTPVLMLAGHMEQNRVLPEQIREDFAMIRRNVHIQAQLVDDLLDITRLARGKIKLEFETTDLHSLAAHCFELIKAEAESKGVELHMDLGAYQSAVSGDPLRLRQVIWNLLSNAVKFTPHNGAISLKTRSYGEAICIEVADTGIGMTPEEMRRAFDYFVQGDHAKTPRRFGGLGLGLSITDKLVKLHSGRIWAESPGRNQGSTFFVELPLSPCSVRAQRV